MFAAPSELTMVCMQKKVEGGHHPQVAKAAVGLKGQLQTDFSVIKRLFFFRLIKLINTEVASEPSSTIMRILVLYCSLFYH